MLSRYPRFRILVVILVATLVTITFTGPIVSAASSGYISGQVTNENNEALPDATVSIIATDSGETVATTTTDQSGYFTVGIETGDYRVEAEYSGGTGYTRTTVSEDQTTTANIVIMGVSPEPATGSITGDVVTENNEALPDATVRLIDVESGNVMATTTTDQEGSYAFTDVEIGQYTVKAEYKNEAAIALVTVSEDTTSTADVVISGLVSDSSPKASISIEAPQSITAGETSELTVIVTNSGSAVATSGGLETTLSGPVSIEKVSGGRTGSPNRFFLSPISPGENRTVIYTLQAEPNVTGEATISTTATVGDSTAMSQATISIKDTPETLKGYYRQDDGKVTFLEVLDAISAYNSDNGRITGYGQVEFTDVLNLITVYNE